MKYRAGFTVVEIVIALIIIAVGFLPIYNLFRQSSSGAVNTIHETIATNYASDLVNLCKDTNYTLVDNHFDQKDIDLEDDSKITEFFTSLDMVAPPAVKAPFIRKMKLTRHNMWDDGVINGIITLIKNLLTGRKHVSTFVVEVTATFPRSNNASDKNRDEVILYTLIMD